MSLNAHGFSTDIKEAAENPDHPSKLHESIQICAIDLMGYLSSNPWLSLASGLAMAFMGRVKENNKMLLARHQEQTQAGFQVDMNKYANEFEGL